MPPLRWTLRTLLVLIAVVAVALGLGVEGWRRATSYRRLAVAYEARSRWEAEQGAGLMKMPYLRPWVVMLAMADYHAGLAAKYRGAARFPWAEVPTDPPPPDTNDEPALRRAAMELVTGRLRGTPGFDLKDVRLTDEDLATLSRQPGIEWLSVGGHGITLGGLMRLKALPGLKRLDLYDCVTPAKARALAKAMPTVTISY